VQPYVKSTAYLLVQTISFSPSVDVANNAIVKGGIKRAYTMPLMTAGRASTAQAQQRFPYAQIPYPSITISLFERDNCKRPWAADWNWCAGQPTAAMSGAYRHQSRINVPIWMAM